MKRAIHLAFCFVCLTSAGQINCEKDFFLYFEAYNHIVKLRENKIKIIAVSDSIVDLDRYWISPELEKYPIAKRQLNTFRENKKYVWTEPYYCSCLDALCTKEHSTTSATHILFFSQVEDNILLAELLPCTNTFIVGAEGTDCLSMSYDKLSMFTLANRYLFIFNTDSSISLFLKEKMIYE